MTQQKQSKKQRKVGRNAATCLAYKTSQRREYNKARRLKRYVKTHSHDLVAWKALSKLNAILFSAQRSALGMAELMKKAP